MRLLTLLTFAAAAIGAAAAVQAEPAPAVRAELPLREVALRNGARRYAMPITLSPASIDAGLDTGEPGVRVLSPDAPRAAWSDETSATLLLADAQGRVKAEALVIDRRAQASKLTFERQSRSPAPGVNAGPPRYVASLILYDPEHGTVAFKAKPPVAEGPQGATP